jgi:uncharacterized protein YkwD
MINNRRYFITAISCLSLFISLISFSTHQTTGLAEELLNQVNKFRTSKGLPELTLSEELNAIAQKHSENMAAGRVAFGHSGFAKRNAMAKAKLEDMSSYAENVAYGASSATEVMTMWKNSAGHRRNMLGDYEYVGIGIAKDRKGTIYYTTVFAG